MVYSDDDEVQILESIPQFKPRIPRKFTCEICCDEKHRSGLFRIDGCSHSYCSDCVSRYVESKLQENVSRIGCPAPGCGGRLDPLQCRPILPKAVFDRWGDALCEGMIRASEKFYCPFKDCSALLVGEERAATAIEESECPECRRLFCAKCRVPWHSEISCSDFQKMNGKEREREDIQMTNLAREKQWKRCPKCGIYVERTLGCNYVVCRCWCRFCYKCGVAIGPFLCSCGPFGTGARISQSLLRVMGDALNFLGDTLNIGQN